MPETGPDYYFRTRENGASVFRMNAEMRNRRLDMTQIATVNLRTAEIKAHRDQVLSDTDMEEIHAWILGRRALLDARAVDDAYRLVDQLNTTAFWAQSSAAPDELDVVTDDILHAMQDLRGILVRKRADRLMKAAQAGEEGNGS